MSNRMTRPGAVPSGQREKIMKRFLVLAAIVLATASCWSADCLGQGTAIPPFTDPYIAPPNPVAGQAVELRLHYSGCGFFGTPTVSRAGNVVTVVHPADAGCGGFSTPPYIHAIPIGSFSPGDYTVIYQTFSDQGGLSVYVPQIVRFTVSALPINAVSPQILIAMALALLLIAGKVLQRGAP